MLFNLRTLLNTLGEYNDKKVLVFSFLYSSILRRLSHFLNLCITMMGDDDVSNESDITHCLVAI